MKKTVLTSLAAIVLLSIPSLTAFAQEYPQYEFFGGFSYARMLGANWIGWDASGAKNLNNYVSIAAEASGLNSSFSPTVRQYMFLAGPQVKSRDTNSRVEPFLHLLLGAAHYSTASDSLNAFALTLGGGFDYRINKSSFALRLIQINYMGSRSSGVWMKGWRFSSGLSVRLGKKSN
jgi:hypothetical protein